PGSPGVIFFRTDSAVRMPPPAAPPVRRSVPAGRPVMSRVLRVVLGVAVVVLLIVGPVAFAVHDREHNLRNFRTVRDGVLYRSGQPSERALKRLVHDYGIRTVISLRDAKGPGLPMPEPWEEE